VNSKVICEPSSGEGAAEDKPRLPNVAKDRRLLTDTFVRALEPAPPGKRDLYYDIKVAGFGLRVTDRGTKSFILYARFPPSHVPTRRHLGDVGKMSLADAREKAREWVKLIELGKDPGEVARQRDLAKQREKRTTFTKVAEDWLADKVSGERKAREVEADVRREFISRWGNRPVTDITPGDVLDVIREVKKRAPAQARNMLGHAKRLFNWAVIQHAYGLSDNPAEKLKPKDLLGKKVSRQRVLTDSELRALWHVAERMDYPYGPVFRMLALTGQRKSEVAEARWREVDLEKRLWIIPPERMKGDAAHAVPLTDEVLELLSRLPRFKKGDHIFTTTSGVKPVNGFSKAKDRLDAAMAAELSVALDPFVIHDLRRTMRTGLSALPIPDRVRELVIAHAQPGLHKVYDQYAYLEKKREALKMWAARLRSIVDPATTSNVVPLHG
jgi:integrase